MGFNSFMDLIIQYKSDEAPLLQLWQYLHKEGGETTLSLNFLVSNNCIPKTAIDILR